MSCLFLICVAFVAGMIVAIIGCAVVLALDEQREMKERKKTGGYQPRHDPREPIPPPKEE